MFSSVFGFRNTNNQNNNQRQLIETLITNIINESMEEENQQNNGLSQEELNTLRDSAYLINNTDHQCSVCLENIDSESQVVELRCEHIFHLSCIERWCENHNSCPLCRSRIVENPENQQSQQNNVRQNQRIIVNNITRVQINFFINGVSFTSYWNSCNTLVEIFMYLSQMNNNYNRIMIQINNKIFKTTESYEYLAQSLTAHGLIGNVNAIVHIY